MDPVARVQTLGPYRLGRRLGVGGMAEVFAAESDALGQIALKRILPGLAEDRDFSDMFWDEAKMTSRLEHPNIVRLLDYGRIDSQLYMALEYVGGPSLAQVLRKAARMKRPVNLSVVVGLIVDLLEALHYVHTATDERGRSLGIVHRDISPGNVMLTTDGELKLGDFGIIRSEVVVRRTLPGELKGKLGYMSPEQALGAQVNSRSDLFSVGVILAEYLTLRPLLLGKTEMHTLSRTVSVDLSTWERYSERVPSRLKLIVEMALRADESARFEDAHAMAMELRSFATEEGLELTNFSRVEELRKLELLPGGQQRSGERPLFGRLPLSRPEGDTGKEGQGRDLGKTRSEEKLEPITLVAVQGVIQRPGATIRPQGRAAWNVEYTNAALPMRLISAFRRAPSGVVELSRLDKDHRLIVELRGGSIFAVHDSEGHYPLGRLMREASLLSPSQLSEAIGESRRTKLRLGQYLVMHGKLRESILLRLLAKQAELRIGRWLSTARGRISVYPQGVTIRSEDEGMDHPSVAALVAILRRHLPAETIGRNLAGVSDAVVLSSHGGSLFPPGLTEPEVRVLRTTMRGGAYEGRALRGVVAGVEKERIARREEAMFALFVGLCSGNILASGFGKDERLQDVGR